MSAAPYPRPLEDSARPLPLTGLKRPESDPTEPRHTRLRALACGLALVVLAAVAVEGARMLRRPPELSVVAARRQDVTRMLAVTGRVEAERTVLVTPQFTGRITEIVRREGESVRAGEILARLEDTAATSMVQQQRATLSSKQSELDQAQRDAARTEQLVVRGAAPSAQLEVARLTVVRAVDELARLTAILDQGRAQLVLVAPFAGLIVRRDGELGQVVGPVNAVFEIATLEAPRVSAEVDERYVRALRPGMHAQILPVGAQDAPQVGTVSYVSQAVDPFTGAATVRFAYASAPSSPLIGMSVDVNVDVESIPGAVTIPREAVGGAGGHPFVLVVSHEHVERREITVDDWPASAVVVRAGLKPGELIALDPKSAASGARVQAQVIADGV
jgi:RND family efflux transporter MFP subunit